MSVSEVTGRISEIQAQLSALAPQRTGASSAAAFAAALSSASTATGATATGGTGSTGTALGDPASGVAADVLTEAKKYVGMPYVWGGSSPAAGGMDCSGLVQYTYGKFGIDLPRVSADQARAGTAVPSLAEARPGDLVAWDNSSRNVGADHIAIWLGDGKILEAARTGVPIRIISLADSGHGTPDYIRRVLPTEAAAPAAAAGPAAARVPAGTPFADLFARAGAEHGVSPALLAAVAKQESAFDPRAVSHAGAQGLMQLMPATARGLGVANPFDPAQAVDGAAKLLSDLQRQFGRTDLALAAYNAGPGAVLRYDGIPPYQETQHYVRTVMATLENAR